MASLPTSKFAFRTAAGDPQPAPTEWARGLIIIDCAPGSLAKARVTRNEIPLTLAERVVDGSVCLAADWPLSGPGHYRLRLELDGQLIEESKWKVEPSKLSTDAFRTMLDDLESRLPVSIAVALQKLGATTGVELQSSFEGTSVAEELARLRRAVLRTDDGPGLAAILREIAQDPHEVLADTELWVPWIQARRVTPSGLIRAAYAGGNLEAGSLPEQLPDARVEASVDVYENRLLKAFVEEVEQRLRRLRRFLLSKDEDELVTEVESLEAAVRAAKRLTTFLDSVGALGQTPTRVTMVLAKRPPYRKLLELLLHFRRRSHVVLEEPALESPLERLPDLYEKWGTLVAIQAVLNLGIEQGFVVSEHRLFGQGRTDAWIKVLSDGRPALKLHHPDLKTRVSVVPQKAYSQNGSPLRSISFRQIPDLAIEVEAPDGARDLYLLDPKYKLDSENMDAAPSDGKAKKADIDKMHAYRDAIRDASGVRVVRSAAILYPGKTQRFDDGLAALSAIPGADQSASTEIEDFLRPALGM